MIILGIDPGIATTGYGVVKKTKNKLQCLDYGIIETDKKQKAAQRLSQLYNALNKLLQKTKPDLMVVERLFFFKNLKTALPVSEARGVILLAASRKKIEIVQLTPLQVKVAICCYGRADKKQVQKMVKKILGLKKIPRPDDAADALALALCGFSETKTFL